MKKISSALVAASLVLTAGCTAQLGSKTYKVNPETIEKYLDDESALAEERKSGADRELAEVAKSPRAQPTLEPSLVESTVMTLEVSGQGAKEKHTRLNARNVIYYYEANSDVSTPLHVLAPLVSMDYRDSKDEFTRRDLLKDIEPNIEKEKNIARGTSRVIVKAKVKLGKYDFDRSAFETGVGSWTYISYGDYAIAFTNGEKIEHVPLEEERARGLAEHLRKSRVAVVTIYGEVVDAEERSFRNGEKKTVLIRADQLNVVLDEKAAYKARGYNSHLGPQSGCTFDFSYCW